MKKNLKKIFYLNVFLFYMGLVGLLMGLAEYNNKYEMKIDQIVNANNQVKVLRDKVTHDKAKLTNYRFLDYKVDYFAKKYPLCSKILDSVYKKSNQYGFSPELILGVIQIESNFNPTAISHRGAYGLMQVNLAVWRNELSIDDKKIFNIDYNIGLGVEILHRYYKVANGNMNRALHLYNNGYKYNNTSYVKKVQAVLEKPISETIRLIQMGDPKLSS